MSSRIGKWRRDRMWVWMAIMLTAVGTTVAVGQSEGAQETGATDSGTSNPMANLEERGAQYVLSLVGGRYESAREMYTDQMREAMDLARLKEIWENLLKHHGPFREMGEIWREEDRGYYSVLIPLNFKRRTVDMEVVFGKGDEGRIGAMWFQANRDPKDLPGGIVQKKVIVGSGTQWPLRGIVAHPKGDGPWPGVVLVHGSGPGDYDGTLGKCKPLRDLAWGLAERGVAVLRYDKRTLGHRQRRAELTTMTLEQEIVEDARAALETLAEFEGVDTSRLYVAGHSLGGMVAPRIVEGARPVAGMILLSPAGRMLHEVMLGQVDVVHGADGEITDQERRRAESVRLGAEAVDALLAGEPTTVTAILGAAKEYWLDMAAMDAPATAVELGLPTMIVFGGRDYQVTEEDQAIWREGIGDAAFVKMKVYPPLNHVYVAGQGESTPAEYGEGGRVNEGLIEDLASWIMGQPADGDEGSTATTSME